MNNSDFNILFNNLKNYSNSELNNLTLDIIQNKSNNSLLNNFSKKYQSSEIVNSINKINLKLFGGEDIINEGIKEAADLRVELDAARDRIDILVKQNKELRDSGNEKKNIFRLRQRQKKEKESLTKNIAINKQKILKLNNLKKKNEISNKKLKSNLEKFKIAKQTAEKSLEKVKKAKEKLRKQKKEVEDADQKVKAKLNELARNKAKLQKNQNRLKKLEKNNEIKLQNLQQLEKIVKMQQKKADDSEKRAQDASKRVDDARTKLKLQSLDFQRNKDLAVKTIESGLKKFNEYNRRRTKEDEQATSEIENNLITSLKSISKIRS